MIYLGLGKNEKETAVSEYRAAHDIRRVIVISPEKFIAPEIDGADYNTYKSAITYVTFYRLLQEVDEHTLIVLNECLRTQNRYDLTYNCIRHFLAQTAHQLIFQQLPQIDIREDFMILFDFDTKSRWKRRAFSKRLIEENAQVSGHALGIGFSRVNVAISEKTRERYTTKREKMFNELGARDPHIIPRNLYLIGGKDKKAHIAQHSRQLSLFSDNGHSQDCLYVARNKRLKTFTYRNIEPSGKPITLIELPHRFIDYGDFIQRTGQSESAVLVADLKVDEWYYQRYTEWAGRVNECTADVL